MFSMRARTLSASSSFLDCSLALSGSRYPKAHWPSPRLGRGRRGAVGGGSVEMVMVMCVSLGVWAHGMDGHAEDCAVGLTPRACLLYTSPSPRDGLLSRMPSS